MPLLSGLTACWRWLRPCACCGRAAGRARTVRNARRSCRAPVAEVRLDPVPEWEELPEASRAAAGCLMAVLMMRMIRAGRAGPGEDGHDERGGAAALGTGREQGPGMAPGSARRRLPVIWTTVHFRSSAGRAVIAADHRAVRNAGIRRWCQLRPQRGHCGKRTYGAEQVTHLFLAAAFPASATTDR